MLFIFDWVDNRQIITYLRAKYIRAPNYDQLLQSVAEW